MLDHLTSSEFLDMTLLFKLINLIPVYFQNCVTCEMVQLLKYWRKTFILDQTLPIFFTFYPLLPGPVDSCATSTLWETSSPIAIYAH